MINNQPIAILEINNDISNTYNELKSRFIAIASHKFRTPLATILSSRELLEYYSPKLPESEKQDLFRQIEAVIKRMTQLLRDVFIINKAEARKLEFNPTAVNLKNFCYELVAWMQLNTDTKNKIMFIHQGNCIKAVMGEKLLRHIMTNLLINALKYSIDDKIFNLGLIAIINKPLLKSKIIELEFLKK